MADGSDCLRGKHLSSWHSFSFWKTALPGSRCTSCPVAAIAEKVSTHTLLGPSELITQFWNLIPFAYFIFFCDIHYYLPRWNISHTSAYFYGMVHENNIFLSFNVSSGFICWFFFTKSQKLDINKLPIFIATHHCTCKPVLCPSLERALYMYNKLVFRTTQNFGAMQARMFWSSGYALIAQVLVQSGCIQSFRKDLSKSLDRMELVIKKINLLALNSPYFAGLLEIYDSKVKYSSGLISFNFLELPVNLTYWMWFWYREVPKRRDLQSPTRGSAKHRPGARNNIGITSFKSAWKQSGEALNRVLSRTMSELNLN